MKKRISVELKTMLAQKRAPLGCSTNARIMFEIERRIEWKRQRKARRALYIPVEVEYVALPSEAITATGLRNPFTGRP